MKITAFCILAFASIVACTPPPSAGSPGIEEAGAGTSNDYGAVCGHLATLGCPEGKDPNCAAVITKVQGGRLEDLKPACLLDAKTVTAVRACGTVQCASAP